MSERYEWPAEELARLKQEIDELELQTLLAVRKLKGAKADAKIKAYASFPSEVFVQGGSVYKDQSGFDTRTSEFVVYYSGFVVPGGSVSVDLACTFDEAMQRTTREGAKALDDAAAREKRGALEAAVARAEAALAEHLAAYGVSDE